MMLSGIPGFRRRPTGAAALAVMAALLVSGCDKAQLLAPTRSSISVSAASLVVPLDGSTEVTALVLEEAGTPVGNGTTVRFTTTLGRVEPAEVQTRNGFATTTFFAGNVSGKAVVRAISGNASGGDANTNSAEITVGAAAAATLAATATPSTVPTGGGTVTIAASALDASGNRLVGVPVTFTTTAGTLSAPSATTDSSGEAQVTLTTNRAATVTARAGNQSRDVTVGVASPSTVAITVSPNPGTEDVPVTLTVTPTVATGNPPPRVVITWGDGTSTDLGVVSAARGVTHTYESPGTYSITATATADGETTSTSTTVTINARSAPTITPTPTSGTGTTATVFSFTITPAANTFPTNVVVDFGDGQSVELGAIRSATTVTHQYSSTGSKTVRVTQTDRDGGTSTAVVVVTVT